MSSDASRAESPDNAGTPQRLAIGITFGNSNSSIASCTSGDALVIANEEGDRQIPSILSYVEGEEYHGTQAKVQLVRNAKNTVAGFRDFLGKKFEDIDPTPAHNSAHPQKDASTISFSIHDTAESESPSTVSISEITTRHLRRLKNSASDYLGRAVNEAVVTVPTNVTKEQKAALTKAASDAGLQVLQYIPEPIASLLAHDRRIGSSQPQDKTVVVADLGGTRSDIAVVSIRGGMYTILSTTHDYSLGGTQLDSVLIEHFAKEFLKKHKNAADPRTNPRSLAKLRLECEAVKKSLSLGSSAGFNVESLSDGLDFSSTINRSRYELLAGKTFSAFLRLIGSAVQKACLDPLDIDDIVLTGGTAHTPRIAQNLRSTYPQSTRIAAPATDPGATNPSELTVRGAALQAFLIQDFEPEDIEQSTHPAVTVTPHLGQTLGLVLGDDTTFRPMLPAETPLPVRRTITLNLTAPSEGGALIRLCEGIRDIKVTQPEPKSKDKTNGAAAGAEDSDAGSDDSDDEGEEEPTREKIWKVGAVVGELALRDAKKGSKVTVQVQVSADMEVTVSAMVAGKQGVKGTVPGSGGRANGVAMNGSAH